jgi:F-type H+-transporting ATPase subunit epsilon
MAGISCVVVTPEATVLEETADFVVVPLFDGEMGIADHHSPMIGRLGYGELRLRTGANIQRYYVDGGFVEVVDNVVTVLTNQAIPAGEVDTGHSEEQLADAQQLPGTTPEQYDIRERHISQARAKIRVASRG